VRKDKIYIEIEKLRTLETIKCKHCRLIFKEDDILREERFSLKVYGKKNL